MLALQQEDVWKMEAGVAKTSVAKVIISYHGTLEKKQQLLG